MCHTSVLTKILKGGEYYSEWGKYNFWENLTGFKLRLKKIMTPSKSDISLQNNSYDGF